MPSCEELTPPLQLCPPPLSHRPTRISSHCCQTRSHGFCSCRMATICSQWPLFGEGPGGPWAQPCPSPQVSQSFPGHQDLVFHHLLAQLGRHLYGSLLCKEAGEKGGAGALRLSRGAPSPTPGAGQGLHLRQEMSHKSTLRGGGRIRVRVPAPPLDLLCWLIRKCRERPPHLILAEEFLNRKESYC